MLEKATVHLAERVDCLTSRLTPVLRSEPCSDGKEPPSPPVRTPLGGALREFRERIERATMNLARLQDLLEV